MEELHELASSDDAKPAEYEPPEVERVMDAEELGREVYYAGGNGSVIPISDIRT